jgi:probable HAF family extracellular repeat protein
MKPFARSTVSAVFLLMALGAAFKLPAGPVFSVETLGALGNGAAMPTAFSSGHSVGFVTNAEGGQVPVSFDRGSATPLGSQGIAAGVNSSGVIVGTTSSGVTEWSSGRATNLHIPGYGNAINDAGQVAGAYQASATELHAFVSTNDKLRDLGTLGGNWSSADAINSKGQVAGVSLLANGNAHAFIWNGYGLSDIGTLGGANSYASGINNHGEVAGTAQTSAGYLNAFSWTSKGMVGLGTLGGSVSAAYGVNDSGNVVGYSLTAGNGATHGFFDENGIMFDLNNLLPLGSQWTITAAYAVDNYGDILGTGSYLGQSYAVELSSSAADGSAFSAVSSVAAPEPSALILVGIGLIVLARLGRSKAVRLD